MSTFDLTQLSNTLRNKRKALKLTQLELSEKTGINRSVISKIETGEYSPSLEQLSALCDALSLSPATLSLLQLVRALSPSLSRMQDFRLREVPSPRWIPAASLTGMISLQAATV